MVIDSSESSIFEPTNRIPDPMWVIDILSSLIILSDSVRTFSKFPPSGRYDHPEGSKLANIAHFSVKEYLISTRLIETSMEEFNAEEGMAVKFMASSCLAYIEAYAMSGYRGRVGGTTFCLMLHASYF
jgi:hypothetical protein